MTAEPDIKRRTELFICSALRAALPGYIFVPFTGGTEEGDAFEVIPPFTVVYVTNAVKTHQADSTFRVEGSVQVITHAAETRTPTHAAMVKDIYNTLLSLQPNGNDPNFSFHGIDIDALTTAQDTENSVHADVIGFAAGVGG